MTARATQLLTERMREAAEIAAERIRQQRARDEIHPAARDREAREQGTAELAAIFDQLDQTNPLHDF